MSAEVTPVPFDSLAKGDALTPFTLTLPASEVRAYLEATGEPVARWPDLVPPLMLVARMIGGLMERIEIPDRLLHTGQEFEMHRALRQDETVEIRFEVSSLSTRQGALMAAFGMDALSGDEPVASARASIIVPPAEEGAA